MFEILKLFQEGSLSSHANSSSRRGTLTIRYAAFRRLRRYPHRADHWRRTGNRRCGRYSLRTKSHALRVARRYNWARSGGRVPVDQTARSRCHANKLKRPGSGARCQLSALVRVIGGFLEERTYNVAKANDRLWSQTACGACFWRSASNGTDTSLGKVRSNLPATKARIAVERLGMIWYSIPSRYGRPGFQ